VDGLLAAVARQMAGYVERDTINEESPTGARGFQILR